METPDFACDPEVTPLGYDQMTESPKFADGGEVFLGARVFRTWPQDGTPRAGTRKGPLLRVFKLRDYKPEKGPAQPRGLAVLRDARTGQGAGTEPVANLLKAPGHQPRARGPLDPRPMPKVRVKGDGTPKTMTRGLVSSIRLNNELREQLAERGDEMSTIMRRDLSRLYDLLAETRLLLVFPTGTLDVLAKAWTTAAPAPDADPLRPQWFLPVMQNALRRMPGARASTLDQFLGLLTPTELLAVQDVVERYQPESSGGDRLRAAGLREGTPRCAGSPQKPAAGSDGAHDDG